MLTRDPTTDRFVLETKREDFLGTTATELYKDAFYIVEADRLFLEYADEATRRQPGAVDPERLRLELLLEKAPLGPTQQERLAELRRRDRLISRTQAAQEKRKNQLELEARISRLELENRMLKAAQRTPPPS